MSQGENTRGFKNKNPGNLDRVAGVRWKGQLPEAQEKKLDNRFCVFKDHKYGIRALATTLKTYATARRARNGSKIDTVAEVIERWAPPSENDTKAYARAVANALDVTPDTEIDLLDPSVMRSLVEAIISHECSGLKYSDDLLDEGLALAGFQVSNGGSADTDITEAPTPKVEKVVKTNKEASAGRLANIGAAVAAAAAATSAVVAELPKIVESVVEAGDKFGNLEIIKRINVWDWLPVGLSLTALVVILLLARKINSLIDERRQILEEQ